MKKKVVGLGEVLWDLLPERTCLGGAPSNFAYVTTLMGDQGIVASRVGEDSRGLEALRRMEELGLDIDHVQTDRASCHRHGKSRVRRQKVRRSSKLRNRSPGIFWSGRQIGSASPNTPTQSALDLLRNVRNRVGTRSGDFLSATSPHAVKVFDVNLRQSYYSQEILAESMKLADIVKLNDEELPKIMSLESIVRTRTSCRRRSV